jgi:hypothetical protein
LYFLITVTDPLVGDVANPVREYWLALLVDENLRLNLGSLVFGLPGIWSLAPLAVLFVIALAALVFLGWRRDRSDHFAQ